jgi:hypothetical protein
LRLSQQCVLSECSPRYVVRVAERPRPFCCRSAQRHATSTGFEAESVRCPRASDGERLRSTRRQRNRCTGRLPPSRRRLANRLAGEPRDDDTAGEGSPRFAGGRPCQRGSWTRGNTTGLRPRSALRIQGLHEWAVAVGPDLSGSGETDSYVTGTERGNPQPGR